MVSNLWTEPSSGISSVLSAISIGNDANAWMTSWTFLIAVEMAAVSTKNGKES